MRVVVLVPRREDHGHRDRVWKWLRPHFEFPVFEGHHTEGPFNRSAAINRAAAAAGQWDVAIINDADCYVPPSQLRAAVRWATVGKYALAYDRYKYLSEDGTARILGGFTGDWAPFVEWTDETLGSSPFAIGRELWEKVGGFDESFVGWGWEDGSFALACRALSGLERIHGPLFHLWHSPGERADSPSYEANRLRGAEYRKALMEGRMVEFLR